MNNLKRKVIQIGSGISEMVLSDLMDFVAKYCDEISVTRYYFGYLSIEDFCEMQKEYVDFIVESDKDRREHYISNINGYADRLKKAYGSEDKVQAYFDRLVSQEREMCDMCMYDDFKDREVTGDSSNIVGYIKSKFTRITPMTRGPVQEIVFLSKETVQEQIITNLDGLYEYPYEIKGFDFENLTFYDEGNHLLAVCSHENMAYMELSQNQYQELENMGLLKKLALSEDY